MSLVSILSHIKTDIAEADVPPILDTSVEIPGIQHKITQTFFTGSPRETFQNSRVSTGMRGCSGEYHILRYFRGVDSSPFHKSHGAGVIALQHRSLESQLEFSLGTRNYTFLLSFHDEHNPFDIMRLEK